MSQKPDKPTVSEMIVWAIPTVAGLIFTVFALAFHIGVEWGLGATLFGILYFLIRYGSRAIETPDQ